MAPTIRCVAAAALAGLACAPSSAFLAPIPNTVHGSAFSGRPILNHVAVRPRHAFLSAHNAPRRATRQGASMNLGDRFIRVAKANLNSILQKWEDPEKVLEQSVEDMQRDLVKIRQSYAEVSATQKRMQRQKEQADQLATEWYNRAQLALTKGDEPLAREALTRRQQQTETASSLAMQMETQANAIGGLFTAMQQLEAKINEAKAKKDQLIARARTAKTSQKVNDMLSSVTGTTSMDAFDRMAEKVEALEAQAEVAGQLTGAADGSLEQQFRLLEGTSAVDQELMRMKQALPEGKEVRALPAAMEEELRQMKEEMQ